MTSGFMNARYMDFIFSNLSPPNFISYDQIYFALFQNFGFVALCIFFAIMLLCISYLHNSMHKKSRKSILIFSDLLNCFFLVLNWLIELGYISKNTALHSIIVSSQLIPGIFNIVFVPMFLKELYQIKWSQMLYQFFFFYAIFIYSKIKAYEGIWIFISALMNLIRILILLLYFPFDSPVYLLFQKKEKESLFVLQTFGNENNIEIFMDLLKVKIRHFRNLTTFRDLFYLHGKIFFVSLILLLTNTFSGTILVFYLLNYTYSYVYQMHGEIYRYEGTYFYLIIALFLFGMVCSFPIFVKFHVKYSLILINVGLCVFSIISLVIYIMSGYQVKENFDVKSYYIFSCLISFLEGINFSLVWGFISEYLPCLGLLLAIWLNHLFIIIYVVLACAYFNLVIWGNWLFFLISTLIVAFFVPFKESSQSKSLFEKRMNKKFQVIPNQ